MLVRSDRLGAALVVYLAGGPGAASVASGFLGNGPWSLQRPFAAGGGGSLAVRRNRSSWNRIANVVYLDQPRYSGYSTGTARYVTSMAIATRDFIRWLDRFRLRHPALARRPLYLAGESFAGQYIPAFAGALMAGDSARSRNLAGLMLISPLLQDASYPPRLDLDYLCGRSFLPTVACDHNRPGNLRAALNDCVTALAVDQGQSASAAVMADVNNSPLPSCTSFVRNPSPTTGLRAPTPFPTPPAFRSRCAGRRSTNRSTAPTSQNKGSFVGTSATHPTPGRWRFRVAQAAAFRPGATTTAA
jgi:carboxypeptidase C (cathepsin A)